jgi:hypothetical protein
MGRVTVSSDLLRLSWRAYAGRGLPFAVSVLVLVYRFGLIVGLIPVGFVIVLTMLFLPRSIEMDSREMRFVRIVPFLKPKTVAWVEISRFDTSTRRGFPLVGYWLWRWNARWWYPAGWSARNTIVPTYAYDPGGKALSVGELRSFLEARRKQARAEELHDLPSVESISSLLEHNDG